MKIENEWLDAEINMLTLENKQKKKRKISDNFITFKLFLMLTAVFFYAPLIEARCTGKIICFNKNSNSNMAVVDGGHRQFKCQKCRSVQWHDKKNADWAGNFYCTVCGANLGK
jgi:hypothetical protein